MAVLSEKFSRTWQRCIRQSFPFWQRLGVHVVPNHFYQPIPDTRELSDKIWQTESKLVGININEQKQLDLLAKFATDFKTEYDQFPSEKTNNPHQYFVNGGAFSSVDGEILYSMIRHFKPKRVYEIGSGYSTYLSAQALLKNESEGQPKAELVAIEPYPNDVLKAGFPGLTRLIQKKVQDVPLSEFNALEENDILFIDSSHVLHIGSDVQYEFLELLPRLNKGVIIHVHDIFLPVEYPKDWIIKHLRLWTEQYLLQAFLTCNDSFEVLWGGSYMHLKHPDKLKAAFASYSPQKHWPGSFWMKRIK